MRKTLALALTVVSGVAFSGAASAQLTLTPSQTEGPYYPITKPSERDGDLTRVGNGPVARGEVLVLSGRVVDPEGKPIENARVEIWQTDARGIYFHPGDGRFAERDKTFQFYGDIRSAADGTFGFRTIFPGRYTGRPRHIHAKITPPGGRTLTTQFYFREDRDVAQDPIVRRTGAAMDALLLRATTQPDKTATADVTVVVRR
jgi:protocatechuate 3,4-dioxygenase, beta subunit